MASLVFKNAQHIINFLLIVHLHPRLLAPIKPLKFLLFKLPEMKKGNNHD